MRQAQTFVLALALLLVPACAHKPPAAPSPESGAAAPAAPTPAVPAVAPAPAAAAAPAEQACSKDDDCSLKALCIRNRCVDITPEIQLAECSQTRVHFDFDAYLIRAEDKPRLDRVARCLRADQKLHVTIEGNADERGTEEYNLQLGDKRATAVERYLQVLGVPGGQLKSISYGYEKPLCAEHNEECWSKNRRAGLKAQPPSR